MRRLFYYTKFQKYSKIRGTSSSPMDGLKRIKSFVEVLSSKEVEKELNLDDIKQFYGLTNITKDCLESSIVESMHIKNKIQKIISMNKDLDKNLELAKYLFYDLQRERNDLIFKLLLANNFSNLKKSDEDSSFLEFMQYICFNLKTIDPKLINNSEILLTTFQEITKDISSMENYKAVESGQIVNFLNIFPKIGVDVTEENMFKYHAEIIFEDKLNFLGAEGLSYTEAIDYFSFFLNFKDSILDLKRRLDLKDKFKNHFSTMMLEIIKTADDPNSQGEDNLTILMRYDELFTLISNSGIAEDLKLEERKDKISNFIKLCQYVLNLKLNKHVCSISTLLDIGYFYSRKRILNKSILHFIAFNCIEHLRMNLTLSTFENHILRLYALICENIDIIPKSETVEEFFEEFKSCIFYNKFLDITPSQTESGQSNLNCISIQALDIVHSLHKYLMGSAYYDPAFNTFLIKTINLNKSLVSIF